ncbi:protein adenylyltransferase SelO [Thalassotalea sp. PLHSN55]|uniref:protein adenylyltransferase SelO n=1 Tax=Thalassotalea sp. PLHSN55 TaxID=3435888 RepID=UPI003F84BAB5
MLNLTFVNQYISHLPGDSLAENYPRQVEHAAYSFATPKSVAAPKLIAFNDDVANELDFSFSEHDEDELAQLLTGNQLTTSMQPYAMCYGGHQFGGWAGQLGDGRAINLGDIQTKNFGHKTIQLKGAGPTPYSRTADGLAVLRSSIREFLCSEAMYHLGVPTTRALSLCLTGDNVRRDMFYDGNAKYELGAVVCRVSSSFTRFGSFQLPSARSDGALLQAQAQYCIKTDFPHLLDQTQTFSPEVYANWFNEVCQRTCKLVVHWMRIGFVHGVLNTDNMSILGETIDFGPYGWVDDFDPDWTPNTTDAQGKRYRFGAQAQVCRWNLCQLANAIYPLINDAKPLQQCIDEFSDNYQQQWAEMMAEKLGFNEYVEASDQAIFSQLEELLASIETDMTLFYRKLATINISEKALEQPALHFADCYYQSEQITPEYKAELATWLNAYCERLLTQQGFDNSKRIAKMNAVNPKYVLRNYLSQQAIDKAEQGDYSELHTLQALLKRPYDEQPEFERYAQKRPDWARNKAGCSMLSCSS